MERESEEEKVKCFEREIERKSGTGIFWKFLPSYGMKIEKKDLNKSPDQMSVLMLHFWRVKNHESVSHSFYCLDERQFSLAQQPQPCRPGIGGEGDEGMRW